MGEGKLRGKLERLSAELGFQHRVQFHGWVDSTALHTFYERAKVVAIPTRAPESFCLVGPEAMHFGRPVVAFDAGGISSWLEHDQTGFLVPEQDVPAYAQALERLLTDTSLARRMGEHAREARARTVFLRHVSEPGRSLLNR